MKDNKNILLIIILAVLLSITALSSTASAEGENTIIDIKAEEEFLLLCTNNGVVTFNRQNDTWGNTIHPETGSSGSFPFQTYSIELIPEGGYYVAMPSSGLWCYENEHWNLVNDTEETNIRYVSYDPIGTLWIMGAAYIYKFVNDGWVTYDRGNLGSSSPNNSLDFQSNGTAWICGGWGVSRITDESVEYMIVDMAVPNRLIVDNADNIWISRADTLMKTDGTDWERFEPEDTGAPIGLLYTLGIDEHGTLWGGGVHWIGFFQDMVWTVYDSEDYSLLKDATVYSMIFDENDTLWLGTNGYGLLKFDGNTWTHYNLETGEITTAVEEPSDTPSTIDLLPAYPNPFNPQTTISYVLPEAAAVTLSVYSVTGQQVAVLADEYMGAGSHSVVFDGEGLASGVYFYRLETDKQTITHKLTLVR